MNIFKTVLKILNKNKFIVILYSVILISFGGINMSSNETVDNFVATKPDIYIINNDVNKGITKNLIKYLSDNCNIVKLKDNEEAINDALFYRDANYIIYIPQGFREDFLSGKVDEIEIKSSGDYQSSFAGMILERYIKVAASFQGISDNEDDIIKGINETLSKKAKVNVVSKLDTSGMNRATVYYNFASYSILACLVYIICLILSSFKKPEIQRRTTISSSNYKSINRKLLASNSMLSVILWAVYVIVSFILIGSTMSSKHGAIYILNLLVFTICATTIAFFIGNLVNNKEAISGIVNVIALGSSFLCGAFVPMEYLPEGVLKAAHVLPSYYFIKSNEIVKTMEAVDSDALKPVFENMGILLIFSLLFVVLTNVVSRKKACS
ncbi:MAG: ABC transporter permease [Lachnospiraceae bacterium]|nr:ABC transporter permease [Lachnospiraceae bacterium]